MENRGFNMKDNVQRGARTLFLLKFNAVLILILVSSLLMFTWVFGLIDLLNLESLFALDLLGLSIILLFIMGLFLLCVTLLINFVYWLLWFYRASVNVRTFSKTNFPPLIAVICSLIPTLGAIFHYVILKELAQKTELFLEDRKIDFIPLNYKSINAWFILMVLNAVTYFWVKLSVNDFLVAFFGIGSLAFYISFLSGFIRNEKALFSFSQDEMIKTKVEAVLRERDIEKQRNLESDEPFIL